MNFQDSVDQWERNSRADALWSVLSAPGKRGRKWEEREFFETGLENVRGLFEALEARGLTPKPGKALDFGCGVGRLTQALAPKFQSVIGVDAAPTMIRLAQSYNRQGSRVEYRLNQAEDLSQLPSEEFDCILSLIVLQHIPTPVVFAYLREFRRLLAPGGVLVFQIPSQPRHLPLGWVQRAKEAVKGSLPPAALRFLRRALRPGNPVIPMYPIARSRVEASFAGSSVTLVDVVADAWGGPAWESFTYYGKKSGV
jgi:SAM-dependent methyltransferase